MGKTRSHPGTKCPAPAGMIPASFGFQTASFEMPCTCGDGSLVYSYKCYAEQDCDACQLFMDLL